ncbi:MAG: hypothetical protein INH41_23630 [Myxococcaceae bacterium]|jgi:hypothetical protein|nr:hypothetical protein [Myxococcaceae bacterium]
MRGFLILLVVVGCRRAPGPPASTGPAPEAPAMRCATVEGARLGVLPLTVELGGREVVFAEWSTPDERSSDVVGFAAHLPEGVTVTVSAGGEVFHTASPRWTHPRGVSGPRVHPVERITFCRLTAPAVVAAR